jgi:hypothetical protein
VKIDIACPVYAGILGTPDEAVRRAMGNISPTGIAMRAHGLTGDLHLTRECGWVDLARAELLAAFLKGQSDALLFHDQDIFADGEIVLSLETALRNFTDVGVVFVSYRKREPPHDWIYTQHAQKSIRVIPELSHLVPRVLVRASSGPLGFALISRRALLRLVYCYPELRSEDPATPGKEIYELFLPMVREHRHLGEDAAFFHRCAAAGVRVECLIDAEVDHAGVRGKLSDII